jgi:hypothetical protein
MWASARDTCASCVVFDICLLYKVMFLCCHRVWSIISLFMLWCLSPCLKYQMTVLSPCLKYQMSVLFMKQGQVSKWRLNATWYLWWFWCLLFLGLFYSCIYSTSVIFFSNLSKCCWQCYYPHKNLSGWANWGSVSHAQPSQWRGAWSWQWWREW